MQKKRVVLIIPYFGKFPNYFNYWMESALKNPKFDFLIFTDNHLKSRANIKFIFMDLLEFKKKLQDKVDFKICLNEPYKICDYRPLFGLALQEYIKKYEFWGFCDLDLIWGDLSKFVTDSRLNNYDKIYNLGHLTIIRNNSKMNNLWKMKHHLSQTYRYDEAFRTPYPCHFDETDGLTKICKLKGVNEYNSIDFADVDWTKFNFFLIGLQKEIVPGVFEWENGKLIYYWLEKDEVKYRELAYAHLQKRKIEADKYTFTGIQNQFIIIPNRIIVNANPIQYLKKQKIVSKYSYYNKRKIQEFIKRKKNHSVQQKIYRDFLMKYWRILLDRKK